MMQKLDTGPLPNEQIAVSELLSEGIAAAQAGNHTLARNLLLQVTDQAPDNEMAWLWLASIVEVPEHRLAFLERAIGINPQNERAQMWLQAAHAQISQSLLQKGIAAAREGHKGQAVRFLRQATDQDPQNETAWLWLASVAEAPEERLSALEKALEINPAHEQAAAWLLPARSQCARKFMQQAVTDAQNGNKEAARELFLQATDYEPENETAWLWLASLAEMPEDQLGFLQRVLDINPQHPQALAQSQVARTQLARNMLQKGIAAASSGHRDLAQAIVADVLEYDENLEDAWLLRAYVADSPTEKIEFFERALSINENSDRAQTGLALAKAKLEAREAKSHNWLCPLCYATAPAEPAVCAGCRAVLSLDDVEAFAANQEADVEKLEAAVARFQAEAAAHPEEAKHYYLGLALLNLQRTNEGITAWQNALARDESNDKLRSRLAQLRARQAMAQAEADAQRAGEVKPARAKKTVMVVDDSPTVRKLLTIKLEKHGHRVVTASNGMEALSKINEELPDLILLDVTMPRLDGYQLCKLVKTDAITKHIPVVMLSGNDGFFDKMRGRMAGSVAYLTKPFEPQALLQTVDRYCN
jgi:twitching motility two-component system response regulator PilG